jgi:hypothetical protein
LQLNAQGDHAIALTHGRQQRERSRIGWNQRSAQLQPLAGSGQGFGPSFWGETGYLIEIGLVAEPLPE